MKLLAIGHSVEDHIHIKGMEEVKPGGIFYSVIGLKSFLEEKDELFLLTSMEHEAEGLFSFLYDGLRKDFFQYRGRIPRVNLYIPDNAERCENYENLAENLGIGALKELNSFDGILVNMITGFDLSLEDLKTLRKSYSGIIYLDVHTLSRGLDENNQRLFRLIPDAMEWISQADIVQVNESELHTLSVKEGEAEIAREALKNGLKCLVVTKGELGSKIYTIENGELKSYFQSAIKIDCVNKVGCGDIFGAAFFISYLKKRSLSESARFANAAAGVTAGYREIKDFIKLKNDTFARFN
ncbi:MAG: carbohydrate kinase family protein [Ignavibacteria bacterium]|jgi:sugar/nucleoside kinase (ribokinase family)|nr:carbohydrate kinase family protein [Ignavibacteria bacterium]MCU7504302.1 carbohydrate kinase family protein [Ignavibacteria bacterium]MCU7516147.1 carbohydrate kinase family protein [Ignavibacteria bacterium]